MEKVALLKSVRGRMASKWILCLAYLALFPNWKSTVGDLALFVLKSVPSQSHSWLVNLNSHADLRAGAVVPESLRQIPSLIQSADVAKVRLSKDVLSRYSASDLFVLAFAIHPKTIDPTSTILLAGAEETLPTNCQRKQSIPGWQLVRCN